MPEDIINPVQRGRADRQQYMVAPDQEIPQGFHVPTTFPVRILLPEARTIELSTGLSYYEDSAEEEEEEEESGGGRGEDTEEQHGGGRPNGHLTGGGRISKTFEDPMATNLSNPMFDIEQKRKEIQEREEREKAEKAEKAKGLNKPPLLRKVSQPRMKRRTSGKSSEEKKSGRISISSGKRRIRREGGGHQRVPSMMMSSVVACHENDTIEEIISQAVKKCKKSRLADMQLTRKRSSTIL